MKVQETIVCTRAILTSRKYITKKVATILLQEINPNYLDTENIRCDL